MDIWGQCVAAAVAVVVSQGLARAALLPVQNPTFSRPSVSLAQQAQPFMMGGTQEGWTSNGPVTTMYGGYPMNLSTIIWQNPADFRRVDNLISDPTITPELDPDPSNWPYQGCASIGAAAGNELAQLLNNVFQPNMSYQLTVAVGHNYGSTGQLPPATAELKLALFYMDNNFRHFVAAVDVFNDAATGLSATHMLDFSTVQPIGPLDGAVGKNIGILLQTNDQVTPIADAGGFFNASNVRVLEVPEPATAILLLAGSALLLRRRCR